MPGPNSISSEKLARLIGTPGAPALVDIRSGGEATVPGAIRRVAADVAQWSPRLAGSSVVVIDEAEAPDAHGVAAWLRSEGAAAEVLDRGFAGWRESGEPCLITDHLPSPAADGGTLWVTRARPKVDRIACPWLIRRFVDPAARFLFVPANEVLGVAGQLGAEPFDIEAEGVFWSHRGERCTFDIMLETFGLSGFAPLAQLATVVRGADTAALDIAPEAAGLLAVSLGLSRMYADDLEQLEAGMLVYDAFYRWCRDATGETHNWASHTPAHARVSA